MHKRPKAILMSIKRVDVIIILISIISFVFHYLHHYIIITFTISSLEMCKVCSWMSFFHVYLADVLYYLGSALNSFLEK